MIKFEPKPSSELRVKRWWKLSFTHCNRAIQKPFQFGQNSPAAAYPATCQPYAVDSPSCQLPRRPQVATHRVDASDATSTRSECSISLRHCLGELRRTSASSPGRSTTSPTKPARPELRLDVHFFPLAEHWWGRIANSVASSTSPEFAEITGNVARPLWLTSGRDSSSYSFAFLHSCSSATSTASPLPRFAGVTPRTTAAPPFATASTLGSSRARVK